MNMRRIHLDEDIKSLSEFRTKAASLIQHVRDTKRPLVLTQHGQSAVVLMDVKEYEKLIERLELLADIRLAEEQLSRGEGLDHSDVKSALFDRIGK